MTMDNYLSRYIETTISKKWNQGITKKISHVVFYCLYDTFGNHCIRDNCCILHSIATVVAAIVAAFIVAAGCHHGCYKCD